MCPGHYRAGAATAKPTAIPPCRNSQETAGEQQASNDHLGGSRAWETYCAPDACSGSRGCRHTIASSGVKNNTHYYLTVSVGQETIGLAASSAPEADQGASWGCGRIRGPGPPSTLAGCSGVRFLALGPRLLTAGAISVVGCLFPATWPPHSVAVCPVSADRVRPLSPVLQAHPGRSPFDELKVN